MAKPRRNVQFPHRGNHDGRRASVSEVSEVSSELNSPIKVGINGKAVVSTTEVQIPQDAPQDLVRASESWWMPGLI
jgi:hypothetical protein